jgi:dipeptidyl aminopeptidase/acylaminoacyl peptidase
MRRRIELLSFLIVAFLSMPTADAQKRPFTVDDMLRYRDLAPYERCDIAPDGSFVAYTLLLQKSISTGGEYAPSGVREVIQGAAVYVQDLATHTPLRISAKGSTAFGGRWSPDSRYLAFYTDQGGSLQLAIWDRTSKMTRIIEGIHVRHNLLGESPHWSNNDTAFYMAYPPGKSWHDLRLPEAEPTTGKSIVSIEKHLRGSNGQFDTSADPSPLLDLLKGETDIVSVQAQGGTPQRLCRASGILSFTPSPDARKLAVFANIHLISPGTYTTQTDLHLINTRPELQRLDDERALAVNVTEPEISEYAAWSPDSVHLAYVQAYVDEHRADTGSGELMVADANHARVRAAVSDLNLPDTPKWQSSIEPSLDGSPPPSHVKFVETDAPIWTADGHAAVVLGKGDVWLIDVTKDTARNLTGQSSMVFRELVPTLTTVDRHVIAATDTQLADIALSGDALRIVSIGDMKFDGRGNFEFAPRALGGLLFFAGEASAMHPSDLWLLSTIAETDTTPTRITRINPNLDEVQWSDRSVLHWKTLDGIPADGILLLPHGRAPGAKLPLVAWVYGGAFNQAKQIDKFGLLWEEVYAAHGYAVLIPDIPMPGIGKPYKQIADGVMPAIDAAIATGSVDPQRLGVIGQSYGGYTVNALICQTDRFKAAVSVDGVADLPNVYLGKTVYGTAWSEGQGRMGGTLWDYPDRYIENSPLYHYASVTTPLLIVHGAKDGVVPVEESERMYRGLARLSKEAEIAIYSDADHSFLYWPEAQERDFFDRTLEWFAHYFNDGR